MQQKLGLFFSIAAWAIIIGLTGVWLGALTAPAPPVTHISPQQIELARQPGNIFIVPGSINGVAVNFIVDTGASHVAVPQHIAQQAGLKRGPSQPVSTAGGMIKVHMTRIEQLDIGPIKLRNVIAGINPHDSRNVLLGMSALKQLKMTTFDDRLILELEAD